MNATFCAYGNSGCFWYRSFLPSRGLGAGLVQRDNKEIDEEEFLHIENRRTEGNTDADTIVYHMPWREWQETEIRELKEAGKSVIADVDDSLWAVAETIHPSAEYLGGKTGRHASCINMCDAITASTDYLASELADRFPDKPVFVCENGIDPWRFNTKRHPKSGRFVIGWAGGIGHDDAWQMIGPQVSQFLREHDDSMLMVVGAPPIEGAIDEELMPQCQHVPWGSMYDYIPWMQQFSVGLAPACDTPFYHGKSPLRLLELQAATIPALVSPTTYGEHVTPGVTGFVVPDDGWYDKLVMAYSSKAMMSRVARLGRKDLMERGTIESMLPQWSAAIESVNA